MTDLKPTEDFLHALYGDFDAGHLCLWADPGKASRWFPIQQIKRTAADAIQQAKTRNVYFGIGVHPVARGSGSRGEATGVQAIPGLWVEVDVAGPAHKAANLPPNREDALSLLSLFPHAPSWVVSSGHGFHVWWLFREPWVFADDEERRTAHTLVRRLQRWFQEKARERGWHIDSTDDLARVLRLPGTWNRKPGLPAAPVETLHGEDSRRYSVADFDSLLPEVEEYAVRWEPRPGGAFPLASVEPILAGCAWLRHCRDDAKTLPEPDWYAMLGILGRCQDGGNLAHTWSKPYPGYERGETERKLAHAVGASGPRTCANIRYALESHHCQGCPNWDRLRSPILLGIPREERPPMPGDEDIPPDRGSSDAVHEADRRANAARRKLEKLEVRNGRQAPEMPSLYSVADLRDRHLPEPHWAVEGFIPEGVTMLVAHSKIGKTFLAEDVAVAVALGGRAWGKIPVKQGKVIYLDTEGNQRRVQRRLRALLGMQTEWPADLLMTHECVTLDAAGFHVLETLLTAHAGLRLVVLDTLNAMRPGKGKINDLVKEDYDLIRALRYLGERHACAIFLLHHCSLTKKDDSVNAGAGTHGLAAAASAVLTFKRTRGEHDAIMEITGNDITEEGKKHFKRDTRTGFWTLEGSGDDFMKTQARQEVFDQLALRGKMTPAQLAYALEKQGPEYEKLKKTMRRMAVDEELICEDGHYSIPVLRN